MDRYAFGAFLLILGTHVALRSFDAWWSSWLFWDFWTGVECSVFWHLRSTHPDYLSSCTCSSLSSSSSSSSSSPSISSSSSSSSSSSPSSPSISPTKHKSHYCKTCNACVDGRDHHCVWIGKCVGKSNRGRFVWFNFMVLLDSAYTMITCVFILARLRLVATNMFTVLFCLVTAGTVLALIGVVLFFQVHALKNGTTNVDRVRGVRSSAPRDWHSIGVELLAANPFLFLVK